MQLTTSLFFYKDPEHLWPQQLQRFLLWDCCLMMSEQQSFSSRPNPAGLLGHPGRLLAALQSTRRVSHVMLVPVSEFLPDPCKHQVSSSRLSNDHCTGVPPPSPCKLTCTHCQCQFLSTCLPDSPHYLPCRLLPLIQTFFNSSFFICVLICTAVNRIIKGGFGGPYAPKMMAHFGGKLSLFGNK